MVITVASAAGLRAPETLALDGPCPRYGLAVPGVPAVQPRRAVGRSGEDGQPRGRRHRDDHDLSGPGPC